MKSRVSFQLKGKVSCYPRAGFIPSVIAELSYHLRTGMGRRRINGGGPSPQDCPFGLGD